MNLSPLCSASAAPTHGPEGLSQTPHFLPGTQCGFFHRVLLFSLLVTSLQLELTPPTATPWLAHAVWVTWARLGLFAPDTALDGTRFFQTELLPEPEPGLRAQWLLGSASQHRRSPEATKGVRPQRALLAVSKPGPKATPAFVTF